MGIKQKKTNNQAISLPNKTNILIFLFLIIIIKENVKRLSLIFFLFYSNQMMTQEICLQKWLNLQNVLFIGYIKCCKENSEYLENTKLGNIITKSKTLELNAFFMQKAKSVQKDAVIKNDRKYGDKFSIEDNTLNYKI